MVDVHRLHALRAAISSTACAAQARISISSSPPRRSPRPPRCAPPVRARYCSTPSVRSACGTALSGNMDDAPDVEEQCPAEAREGECRSAAVICARLRERDLPAL